MGLCLLLAVQVAAVVIRVTQDVRYEPLTVGQELPFAVSGWPPLFGAALNNTGGSSCQLAFICNTGCGACSALADRYVEETRSNPDGAKPVWLLGGDSTEVASWADEHGLPGDRVLTLAAKKETFWRSPVLGDVWFTPTRVLLTPELVVRDARPSDELLSHEDLRSLCQDGGIAPQGLEELLHLLGVDEEWSTRSIDPGPS